MWSHECRVIEVRIQSVVSGTFVSDKDAQKFWSINNNNYIQKGINN